MSQNGLSQNGYGRGEERERERERESERERERERRLGGELRGARRMASGSLVIASGVGLVRIRCSI